MEYVTTIAKVIGFLAIIAIGAFLRDKTYKSVRNWNDLWERDKRAQREAERKLRKQQRKALRDFDRQKEKVNKAHNHKA